ncbi:MAG: DUF1002 domain-containing protein [Eubacteriales bacterium]|nr:DUF1002 domain-containing protein [Oscillospiraceae bacterium]MDO4862457.1 DUF1002 domain-containing protein [Eubacteriales bacterium]
MIRKGKRFFSLLLAAVLLVSASAAVWADGDSRVVLGADLTEEQIATVYRLFGVERGSVEELTVTNAEERSYLKGFVDDKVIGKYAISCVYVELLEEGKGLSVETYNVTWCTSEMYKNALATAGVRDAKIIVAAPFEVSGTAALTGIYKAYEHITGDTLDETAKAVGTQELTITGELAEEIGNLDATEIVTGLKEVLGETVKMSDEEIRREIVRIAGEYNVTLSDRQIQQLIDLCRSLEGLDADSLKERVVEAQETIKKIGEAKDKAVGFYEKLSQFFSSASDFFSQVKALFGK